MNKVFNIDAEKEFINLFGYHLGEKTRNSSYWPILDGLDMVVGRVEIEEQKKRRNKKDVVDCFYRTIIDNPTISCDSKRRVDLTHGNNFFEFDVKRTNRKAYHVAMRLGDWPKITVWDKDHRILELNIDYQGLYFYFLDSTEHFNLEEVIQYDNPSDRTNRIGEYWYQISYCDKDIDLVKSLACDSKGVKFKEIDGKQFDDGLEITERSSTNGKYRKVRQSVVPGTIEEMATKHKMGIDSFSQLRYRLNQIMPFIIGEDVISSIVSKKTVEEYRLLPFFPDYEIESIKGTAKQLKPNKY